MKKIYTIGIILVLILIGIILVNSNMTGNVVVDDEIKILKMGLIPADDAAEMLRAYEPVREYLSRELGIPVEIQVTSDYTAAINAMKYEHIDMAWFGPFSYITAAEIAGAEAIVNGVKESTGLATYKSVIIAHVDSEIVSINDLKGKNFAFVDPASTSGNLMPRKMLIENGIDPENDFESSYYAGTHNAVGYAVANGKVDAGAIGDNVYNRMVSEGEINPEKVKIIHKSNPLPGSPIAVRGSLPSEMKEKITQALVDMDKQTINEVDGWGGIARYQRVSDSDYNIIRKIAETLDMDA